MSNQTNNRKKSSFTASTSLPSGAYLDYVSNGVNYRIDLASFQSALGVSGTIVQAGSATGTPVLETSGSVNKIRNIENGPGITSTISPQNGLKLSHNIVDGTGSVSLFQDYTTSQLVAKKLSSGTGITISDLGDQIQINASSESVSSKTVTVFDINDFPAAVAGVITLADDTDYLIVNDITTSNRFVINGKTTVRGATSLSVNLTYTGTGTFLTGTSGSCNVKFQNINIACTTSGSTCFNFSGAGTGQLQFVESRFSQVYTLGTSDAMFLTRFDKVAFADIQTSGLTCTGANSVLFVDGAYVFLNGGTFLDLGTATFSQVIINKAVLLTSAGGTTFLSGAASSANINANGFGTVIDSRTSGSATVLSGITNDDIRWEFLGVNSVADSIYFGMLSMQGNATNTVIALAGTPVLVAGTWVIEETHRTTGTTAGRVTYDAERPQDLNITASITVAPASGGSVTISAYIAVNGTVVTNSKRQASTPSSQSTSITLPWYGDFTSGDYVEVFVANESSTTDLLVSSAILRVG